MKAKIISLLHQATAPVSGQAISQKLGVSRVAVWKHVRQLQDAGCLIEATPKGYCLLELPDTPYPWAFGQRADRVHYFPELASTMDQALALARDGAPQFTVVVADRQTRGRGRLQRPWQSADGGLYFTFILRPDLSPTASPLINLAAALDLARTIEQQCKIHARLKWPNDVLVNDCKIAGILSQMEAEADHVNFINLGIGLNVNNDPSDVQPPAVSIAQMSGKRFSRVQLLNDFWERFERRMDVPALDGVVDEWKRRAVTLGRRVKIQTARQTLEGLAADLDPDGGLILETNDGRRLKVVYGDCFHQGAPPAAKGS